MIQRSSVWTAEAFPLELVQEVFHSILNARFSSIAAGTLIVYDHIITFDQEVKWIWKESWSSGKFLFLATRYYGLFAVLFNNYVLLSVHMTEHFCRYWVLWQGWTGVFISAALAELVLVLRIRALYQNDRTITIILGIGFVLTMGTAAAIVGTALLRSPVVLLTLSSRSYCRLQSLPPYLPTYFIPLAIYETLLGSLAVYKWLREVGLTLRSRGIVPALLRVLVRDSVIYFVVMSLFYCVNAIVWIVAPNSMEVSLAFLLSLSCILINRLILNLRVQSKKHAPPPSRALESAMDDCDLEQQLQARDEERNYRDTRSGPL